MDILTDTLNAAGLKSTLLHQRALPPRSAIQFPCSRSIGFHVVLNGLAFIHTKGKKAPLMLERGDIAFMTRGCDHSVSTEKVLVENTKIVSGGKYTSRASNTSLILVSGAYQLWNDPVHPFFRELPDWFILKSKDVGLDDGLYQMMDLLAKETLKEDLGSERIIQGILDVMFSIILRKVIRSSGNSKQKWGSSTLDPKIKKALDLLHNKTSYDWTLDELAKNVGVSRSGLAARFKKFMGESPLHYLTTLRIQKAIGFLTSSEMSVEQVAFHVGYHDSFTFSKAFKKLTGLPPRNYRRNLLMDAPRL